MKRKFIAASAAALIVCVAASSALGAQEVVVAKADDIALLTKIKTNLIQSGRVDGLDVNVDVKDGYVTLSGKANSEAERASAADIAKGVAGVKGVENKLQLKAK
jgi:hyperosmotically inducible periplasmic protein